MCGIFGFKNFNIDTDKIKKELMHRGPDSFGIKQSDGWTFCHCRLSIIDLSDNAMQPMSSDGNIISFNGEIYNFEELKHEYLADIQFESKSDTEVLLKLIQNYGFKILNKLNGMFAFSYYDNETGSVFLVRDRYGVKPLYYYTVNNSFAFCSEDSVLARILNLPFITNEEYIYNLFNKEMSDYDENTINKNIYSVCAGEYIEITKDNRIIKTKYYNYNDYNFEMPNSNKKIDVIEDFEYLLTDSIRLRNRTDVPAALTLSGGIDSSLIYTLAKEKLNAAYTLFTYSNTAANLDEYNAAKRLAGEYGDKIIRIEYNNDRFIENYQKSLIALNGPIWSGAHAGYYEVYRQIKENGFKVVVEGHGADELLGGWAFTFPIAAKQAFALHKYKLAFDIIKLYKQSNTISVQNLKTADILKQLLNSRAADKDIFNRVLDFIFKQRILPINLRCWDRLPMANSVESRSPFLDYRVVEYLMALNVEYKINKIGNKAILREILKKYKKDYIYKNKVKQPFLASETEFIKNNAHFMLQYYNSKKFNYDIEKWQKGDFAKGYNPKIYKACALGFLENYYKTQGTAICDNGKN